MNKSRTNRDHAKKTQRPMVEDEVIAEQLEALVTPAITAQENYYRQLKLRDRILILPFMIAAVLTLLWRFGCWSYRAYKKRLLGLSYLWTGSINGIKLQIWGTWLFYSILVDLGDAVADELSLPFDRISLEMIYRGLYHFYVAHQKGKASDPVKYFAAPENQDLGIVKRRRKKRRCKTDYCPFP